MSFMTTNELMYYRRGQSDIKRDIDKAYQQGKIDAIKEIIKNIDEELRKSTQTVYVCKDGYEINTDVGYVEEWFEKYIEHNKLKEDK